MALVNGEHLSSCLSIGHLMHGIIAGFCNLPKFADQA